VITALPLYHIFALTTNMLVFTYVGGNNVLITNPRDMPGFVKELAKYRFSFISGVNTLFAGLMNTPGFDKLDFSGLKLTLGGGMAVQRAVAERWKEITKCPLLEAYGLTETSPGACINPLVAGFEYNGTAGLPIPSTVITIRDDDCRILPLGETGEICIAGPQVMKGYWNRPGETAEALRRDADGRLWLYTGDVATMDADGFTTIVQRKKDMIIVSGFNVYPTEIEQVLFTHPAVMEAAVIGVPDSYRGEAVKAFVVLKAGASATIDDLRQHCMANLAEFKRPATIEVRESLPKTAVGKVLRRVLREETGQS
jgi:long-chain acyl-CoA synthetase